MHENKQSGSQSVTTCLCTGLEKTTKANLRHKDYTLRSKTYINQQKQEKKSHLSNFADELFLVGSDRLRSMAQVVLHTLAQEGEGVRVQLAQHVRGIAQSRDLQVCAEDREEHGYALKRKTDWLFESKEPT